MDGTMAGNMMLVSSHDQTDAHYLVCSIKPAFELAKAQVPISQNVVRVVLIRFQFNLKVS